MSKRTRKRRVSFSYSESDHSSDDYDRRGGRRKKKGTDKKRKITKVIYISGIRDIHEDDVIKKCEIFIFSAVV